MSRRAATRNRLIGEGATEATADAWIAAWDEQAAQDGLEGGSAYWQARSGSPTSDGAECGPRRWA